MNTNSFNEAQHPRGCTGQFTEKDQSDPGNSVLTAAPEEPVNPQMAAYVAKMLRRYSIDKDTIPTTRNEVWEYADAKVAETGDRFETIQREEMWEAIVAYRNPKWVVGLTERYRLLRQG